MPFKSLAPAVLGLGLCVGLVACAQEAAEEAPIEEAAAQEYATTDMLGEVRAQFMEHFSAGHAPAVAELYTEDGVYMPASGAFAMGREAISGVLEVSTAGMPTLEINATETLSEGDVAFERGTFSIGMTPEGAEPMTITGNYLTYSKRQADGSWKLHWAASNYDAPPIPEVMATMTQGLASVEAGGDAALDALRAEWESAYNAGDAAAILALHAPDGATMWANGPAAEGAEAMAAGVDQMLMASPQSTITQVATEMAGDWAVARGVYDMTLTPPEGGPMAQAGYWLSVWKKDADGAWKCHWILSNTVAPAM